MILTSLGGSLRSYSAVAPRHTGCFMPEREHLSKQYEQRLRFLKDQLLLMGCEAEQMVADAIRALISRRPSLALDVIRRDDKLDDLEMRIDRLCYEIIALEKPVARDLRFIGTALKIVKD